MSHSTGSDHPSGHIPGEVEVRGQAADTDAAVGVTSYLLAGPLCFGGIGYGLDRWLGTRGFVAVGVLIGVALSVYVIWLRYGGGSPGAQTTGTARTEHHDADAAPHRAAPANNATNEESQ